MSISSSIKEDQIQEQILLAAKRLFQVHGLAKVTMDDVAKAIGKGRSSLYYYYKSKDEIFEAVVGAQINELLAAIEKEVDEVQGAEAKLLALFITKLKVLREKGSFFSSLEVGMDADAISKFEKNKIAHHNMIMQREGALLTRILNRGMESGEIAAIPEKDMDALIFVLLSCLHGLKREMRLENNVFDINYAVNVLIQTIIHGLKK